MTIAAEAAERVQLTTSEAACLDAVKAGLDRKTKIALETKRDLRTVARALETLGREGLIIRTGDWRWAPTGLGRDCVVRVVPEPARRRGGKAFGRLVAGSTAQRLLDLLDRPRHGSELVRRLGVTPQRVHQLVVRLHAQDQVRFGDPGNIRHIVARRDDPSLLLSRDEERVLSALPDEAATTLTRLAAGARMMPAGARTALGRLRETGLVEKAGFARGQPLYRLAAEGRAHFQRRATARRAGPAPLTVKSERVRGVLCYLAEHGEARIRDVRDALAIPQTSMNALMQYLKRKGLVGKVARELSAPYELTAEGREILREMSRRAQR